MSLIDDNFDYEVGDDGTEMDTDEVLGYVDNLIANGEDILGLHLNAEIILRGDALHSKAFINEFNALLDKYLPNGNEGDEGVMDIQLNMLVAMDASLAVVDRPQDEDYKGTDIYQTETGDWANPLNFGGAFRGGEEDTEIVP